MSTGLVFRPSAIVVILFLAASQIISANAGTPSVLPKDRLSIEQPQYSGQWKAYDLTIEYSYSKDQGRLDLSGNVRFANYLTLGTSRLENFRLGVVFLDESCKVLQEVGLATSRGPLDPVRFSRKINLPLNAAFMAFSYQGEAIAGGGYSAGRTSFSFYPIH